MLTALWWNYALSFVSYSRTITTFTIFSLLCWHMEYIFFLWITYEKRQSAQNGFRECNTQAHAYWLPDLTVYEGHIFTGWRERVVQKKSSWLYWSPDEARRDQLCGVGSRITDETRNLIQLQPWRIIPTWKATWWAIVSDEFSFSWLYKETIYC